MHVEFNGAFVEGRALGPVGDDWLGVNGGGG